VLLIGLLLFDRSDVRDVSDFDDHIFADLDRINPYPAAIAFIESDKYADAYEYLSYFMEYDYVRENDELFTLFNEIKTKRDSIQYNVQKAVEGIIDGKSDEEIGQYSALLTDFFVIGDIRDITTEINKYIYGQETDEVILALSSIGLLASGAWIISNVATSGAAAIPASTAYSAVKPSVALLKFIRRIKGMPSWLSAHVVNNANNPDKLSLLLDQISNLRATAGDTTTIKLLSRSKDMQHWNKLREFGTVFRQHSSVLLDITNGKAVDLYRSMKNTSVSLFKQASTYGSQGIKTLSVVGPVKFKQFLKHDALIKPPKFESTREQGDFGEEISKNIAKSTGYKILPSHAGSIHGIDGIYVRHTTVNGRKKLIDVLIVETKTNKSRLASGQMSKEWISNHLEELILRNQVNANGPLVSQIYKEFLQGSARVKTQLWIHDLNKNSTSIYNINNGMQASVSNGSFTMSSHMRQVLKSRQYKAIESP